ncbi:pentatricopeptide repeat-containing protein [Tanacetum coccineum]
MLSRIAKFQSQGNPFGTEEFNLLLRAFCDVTSVKLFYHDMIRRGFSLDTVTYNIRIESYSKQGISHYTTKAQELFDEIHDRYLVPDSGVYNALINAYIRSGNMMSATRVMNEMEENNILPDHVTFHTMFSGLINSSGINGVLPLYHQMI